jgi:hypothetical protein
MQRNYQELRHKMHHQNAHFFLFAMMKLEFNWRYVYPESPVVPTQINGKDKEVEFHN